MKAVVVRPFWQAALAALVALCCAGRAIAAEGDAPPPWELWPYGITVVIAVEDSPRLPPRLEDDLPSLLEAQIAAAVGGAWKLGVTAAPPKLKAAMLHDLGSIGEKTLPAASRDDKVILLAIAAGDRGIRVRARELDLATGLWNATVSVEARQPEYVPRAAARAVLAAFAPLGRIENADGQTATLRIRASALVPHGRGLVAAGAVFRPVLVACQAGGGVTRGDATFVDWTYLTAEKPGGSSVPCRIETGLAGEVIPEYHPLRQRWALGVSRAADATTLQVVSRESEPQPLEGIEILADGDSPAVIGRTDRRGEIAISAGPQTVRTIVVRQGDEVLARLPLACGLAERLTVRVNYDRRLVELQSLLAQLGDDLVDAAARRAILAARVAAAEAGGQSEDLAALRRQSTEAANVDLFLSRLDRIQQSLSSASAATKGRLGPKLAELRKGIDQLKSPPATK